MDTIAMGDSQTFDTQELLAHVGWVRALALRLARDPAEADDATQETLVSALTSRPERVLDGKQDVRPWLGRVLGNALRMRRRAALRRSDHEQFAACPAEAESYDADLLELLERQRQLAHLVQELPPVYRTVLLARFYRDETSVQIAQRLGTSPATVRSQTARGLRLLHERVIQREGGEEQARRALLSAAGVSWSTAGSGLASGASIALPSKVLFMKVSTKVAVASLAILSLLLTALGVKTLAEREPASVARAVPQAPDTRALVSDGGERSNAGMADVGRESTRLAVGATSAGVSGHEVRVLAAESGLGIADAQLLWLDGRGQVQRATTAEDGVKLLQGPVAERDIVAIAPGRVPVLSALAPSAAALEIELTLGAVLSGDVHIEGPPEDDTHALRIVPRSQLPSDWPQALRDAVADEVSGWREGPLETDDSGRFRLAGLPHDWSGELHAENGFQLLSSVPELALRPDAVTLREPLEGLSLNIQRTPRLRGEVRWSDTDEPVTDGLVAVCVMYANGQKSYITNRRFDARGQFAAGVFPFADPYGRPTPETLRVEVHPEGGAERSLELDEWPTAGRLAPIYVQRVPDFVCRVVDAHGQPISDALVAGELPRDYGQYRKYVRTDAQGRARLRSVPLTAGVVTVGALGFGVRDIDVTAARGTTEEPVVIELEDANRLIIELEPGDGGLDDLICVLRHDGPLFEAELEGFDEVRSRFLQLMGTGYDEPGIYSHWFSHGGDPWVLSGLRPDRPLILEVQLADETVLAQRSLNGPGMHDTLRVVLPVTIDRREVRGRVLGPRGRGVANARVHLEWEGSGRDWLAVTDLGGAFASEVIEPAGRVAHALWIDADGFATQRVVLSAGLAAELGTFQLELERLIRVAIQDSAGRDYVPEALWAQVSDGFEIHAQYTDGRHRLLGLPDRFSGLPAEPLTVFTKVGGRVYSQLCELAADQVVIEVPVHGTLVYECESAPDFYPSADDWMTLHDSDDETFELRLRRDQPWKRELVPGEYVLVESDRTRTVTVSAGAATTLRPTTDERDY